MNGWDGSERNIEKDLADLQYSGFEAPPQYVIAILKSYSGIEFEVISKYQNSHLVVFFGLDKALEILCVRKNLSEHEIILGKKLYPIGSIDLSELEEDGGEERLIILVAEDGSVYSSMSYVISQESYSVSDFINRIVDDQSLWHYDESLNVNYSRQDPRLKEFRKRELVEERLSKSK
jgi:hypothetical protein